MTAYVVAIRKSVSDPEGLKTYASLAGAARDVVPAMRSLAAYGKCETLEGEAVQGVVLLEFPTYEDARTWYHSPEYQKAASHRMKASDYQFILFEGK